MKFKVISLNLWLGGKLMPKIIEFLNEQDADLLMLQEVYDSNDKNLSSQFNSYTFLKKSLNYEFGEYSQALIHDVDEGLIPNGNAIISKFPIISKKDVFLTKPAQASYKDIPELFPYFPRLLQTATINVDDLELNIFNIHGVWDLDGDRNSQERQNMKEIILNEAKNMKNIILAGDTNAKASNPALLELEPTLKSVFGQTLESTFNLKRKSNPGYASAAVDLMFVSPNINVISKEAPDVDISDHLPLVVTLEITE